MPLRTVDPVHVPAQITTPSGTLPAAPMSTAVPLPGGILERVRLQIPPGHVGATGLRITLAGQQIVPWSNTAVWLIGDDLHDSFDVDVETGEGFSVLTYNQGNYPHTHYLLFTVRQLAVSSATPTLRLVDNQTLNEAG